MPRTARSWEKPGGLEQVLPQSLCKEPTCSHLNSRLLASRTLKKLISVLLSHPVCDTLLQQPQENNTPAETK